MENKGEEKEKMDEKKEEMKRKKKNEVIIERGRKIRNFEMRKWMVEEGGKELIVIWIVNKRKEEVEKKKKRIEKLVEREFRLKKMKEMNLKNEKEKKRIEIKDEEIEGNDFNGIDKIIKGKVKGKSERGENWERYLKNKKKMEI